VCCITIFKKLIYARDKPIIDPLPPQEQAGFRHGRSAVDQVTQLTQDIEDSFSAKKVGAVCVDLTAAYVHSSLRSLRAACTAAYSLRAQQPTYVQSSLRTAAYVQNMRRVHH